MSLKRISAPKKNISSIYVKAKIISTTRTFEINLISQPNDSSWEATGHHLHTLYTYLLYTNNMREVQGFWGRGLTNV